MSNETTLASPKCNAMAVPIAGLALPLAIPACQVCRWVGESAFLPQAWEQAYQHNNASEADDA